MPRKPMHPCKEYGCARLTYDKYCSEHSEKHTGEYNRYCRRQGSNKAYGSSWRKVRDGYIKRHPLCERCLEYGNYTTAVIVHHIVPVSFGGSNNESNLKSLCRSCHEWVHKHEIGDK